MSQIFSFAFLPSTLFAVICQVVAAGTLDMSRNNWAWLEKSTIFPIKNPNLSSTARRTYFCTCASI